MALEKRPVQITFAKGLDQKTDPYQVQIGNFLRLENMVFNKGGRLTKRNGFSEITSLPTINSTPSYVSTFNNNLIVVGSNLLSYIPGPNQWVNNGALFPIDVTTMPIIRSGTNQTQGDSVVSGNLVCTVYTDKGSGSTLYKYVVSDSVTGQVVLPAALIPNTGVVTNAPRVFVLGQYFILLFGTVISAVNHLQYVAISIVNPVAPIAAVDISAQFTPSTTLAFDAYSVNNSLYIAWNGNDGGGAIRVSRLDSTLVLHTVKVIAGKVGTIFSVYPDITGSSPNIWISFWDSGSTNGFSTLLDTSLNTILAPTQILTSQAITNLTSTAQNRTLTFFYEVPNNYSYDSSIPTHFIKTNTLTSTGTLGSATTVVRSVGLASKAFLYLGQSYFLSVYQSSFQPTYFLLNQTGQVISKLAYSNSGGYKLTGLPNAIPNGTVIPIAYEFADLVEAVNKSQGATNTAGVYSQTGVNLVYFDFDAQTQSSEIGSILNLTGGMPWMYDGVKPVELGFQVWPDSVEVTTSTSGGSLADQQYFYQAIYSWIDNQGNAHRSAPSIPVGQVTSGGGTSTNTVNVPTLRLTYKTSVTIEIYRWSAGQQDYFQVTTITLPLFSNTTSDSVAFTDTFADSAIAGNSLIYTTGGVIENIAGPSCIDNTLFDSRLWILDAEDRNLLWYSKPVIEGTTVETSDLFTLYVAPNISSQGSTGPSQCIAPMDDKLIIFKRDAMYFVNGVGPDSTGLNDQYSEPIFISSAVGSSNKKSIVLTPNGLMFQSDKGIWMLGRDLSTTYIGAPVEDFSLNSTVLSATSIPATTQIRFVMDSGLILMYDYFYNQWGVFKGIPATSSTLYLGMHTLLNQFGQVYQETPGSYLDGSNPVLQAFTTAWVNSAGLMDYQRAYWMYLLGTFYSPHRLSIQVAYDYDPNPSQQTVVTPNNSVSTWGSDATWGGSGVWGGGTNVEQAQVYFTQQRCESFLILVDEVFDPSYGTTAGQGLSLSGLNLVIGVKKIQPTLPANQRFG